MKFEATRAKAIFEKLGDPAFAGPEGEVRIAEFVAGEFERMGWKVERREVEGSRFPQRVGPWIGWLGYGALVTVTFCMILSGNARAQFLAILIILGTVRWPQALASNSIRPGRRMRPLANAPVVIASGNGDSSSPMRVVFQVVLGRLDTGYLGSFRVNRYFFLTLLHLGLWISAILTSLSMHGYPVVFSRLMMAVTSVMIAFVWVMIVGVLTWEHRQSCSTNEARTTDRLSTALVLELARSWPRRRSGQLEPIFIVAGGQRLDYAGSREVVRMLESEWPRKPSLLLLLFAPGAEAGVQSSGSVLRITALRESGCDLARNAAESLWIPNHRDDWASLDALWPFDLFREAEPIALIGSDLGDVPVEHMSPEALQRAAQLATEIVLRWAKVQKATADADDIPATGSESAAPEGESTGGRLTDSIERKFPTQGSNSP
jgi:hypothetical protein